uniref:C-type lectin domain-containing protein n=1 Tax=Seriola lalandi dorsalis TaxID=1841481 RepID=A0A3B4XRI6_SERLL
MLLLTIKKKKKGHQLTILQHYSLIAVKFDQTLLCSLSEENMERNIPSLLLFHFVFFVLLTPPCAATSGLNISKVVHISRHENWWVAQAYCRKYHSDLVTIRNAQDNNKTSIFKGWIGLSKWSDGVWKWSSRGEISRFFSWDSGEPDQGERCAIKYSRSIKWRSRYCSHTQPFLCMDERLILVQERKTWEEALQHCRRLKRTGSTGTKYLYDLVSLPEAKSRLLYGETT